MENTDCHTISIDNNYKLTLGMRLKLLFGKPLKITTNLVVKVVPEIISNNQKLTV